jgi:hypothetical protein
MVKKACSPMNTGASSYRNASILGANVRGWTWSDVARRPRSRASMLRGTYPCQRSEDARNRRLFIRQSVHSSPALGAPLFVFTQTGGVACRPAPKPDGRTDSKMPCPCCSSTLPFSAKVRKSDKQILTAHDLREPQPLADAGAGGFTWGVALSGCKNWCNKFTAWSISCRRWLKRCFLSLRPTAYGCG